MKDLSVALSWNRIGSLALSAVCLVSFSTTFSSWAASKTPVKSTWKKPVAVKKAVVPKVLMHASDEAALSQETPLQANAVDLNLMRGLELTVDGYDAGKAMPQTFTSAAQVIQTIDSSPIFIIHMEALRRSYTSLSKEARTEVLETLLKRHKANEASLEIGFDYGYAQLLYNRNKTGLFFLRKANDRFKTQFTALAYGMAELEADLALENAKPDEMTTRKLDVIYQLGDAVQRDALAHSPGFWPSFVRVLQSMKSLPAYGSFPNRDYSLAYVPIAGMLKESHLQASSAPQNVPIQTSPVSNLLNNSMHTGCTPQTVPTAFKDLGNKPAANPIGGRTITFNKTNVLLQFYPTDVAGQSRVKVSDASGQLLLSFKTFAKPAGIVEDLDSDGTQEIVARQYSLSPFQPVLVYRFTPCGFELDHKVFDEFR